MAEIVPRLLSASPDRVFGHPGSGSTVPNIVHLELEGFDPTRHQVHLGGVLKSFSSDGLRRGYIVPQLSWIDPGLHEVRIRWRQGVPMVGGDPPVNVRILNSPQITNITPDPVVSGGTINISGTNFGSYLNFKYGQLGVVFYSEDGSPSSVSGTVRRVGDLGMEGENQNSFLVVEVPNITVEEREYEVAVTTPRGTSPSVPVTIVREADPPYQRHLRNYRITEGIRDIQETSAQVLSWASHSPAPPGQRQWIVECVPTSCPDPPATRTSVHLETLPETSPSHSSRELVSHPPGFPGQPAIPAENCGPCDGGTSAQDPHPNWPATPDRWEDVDNQQVNDTIRLAGDIAGVYTGSHARIIATPGQSADSNGPGPVRFVGEGIILQGASHVEVELTPNELAGSQILAVRSSSDIQISINMPEGTVSGTSPLGIVIENSSRVSVTGNIRRANLGILVRNSTLVDLSSLEIHPEGAGGRGIDIDGGSMISVGSIDFFGGVGGTQDERKGLRLRGGLSDSRVVGVRFYGLAKGMEVEDVDRVRFGTMTFGSDGSAPFTGNLIGAVIEGGMRDSVFANAGFTGNDIGMEVRGGVGNLYNSISFGATNLGQVGAGNRLGMRIEDTGQPMSDNVFWFLNFNRNRQRHLELINLDDPGVFRAINLGASQVQAGVYPTLFEDNLVIQGCQNLEMRNLVVRGGINGVVIEDSSDIRFHGITCNDQTGTGLRAERTHGLELFDGTIRGEFSGDPANFLNRGIHLIACSDFHFARLSVEVTTVSGIEIEQAPEDSFGLSRLLGRKNLPGQTSPAVEPPRETTFSPFRRPPLVVSTYNSTNMVRVTARSGPAVYIHSGAGDLALGGMSINSGDGPALYLRDAGRNISVTTSNFTPSSQAVGEHSGILIEDCTAGDIDIGIPDEGNNITRTRAWGVEIRNSQGVRVRGNYIGTEGLGTFPQPNALGGILVENSGDIEIGGADPVDGNLISGNDGHGVVIRGLGSGNPTLIQGNFIGTTPTGTLDLPNDGFGILMEPAGAESGQGGAVVAENLISSNVEGGIHVSSLRGAEGVTNIRRNIIGRAFPFGVFGTFIGVEDNPADGILVTDSSGIVIQENRIAWHDGSGIVLAASDRCHLQDNAIFAHVDHGLHIRDASSGHKMLNNEFANNGGMGVRVESFSRRNSISAGEFRDNTTGQIHLEPLANDDVPAPIVCEVYTRQLDDMMRLVFVRGQVAPFLPDGTRVELFASNDNVNANRLLNATVSWDGHFHSLVAEIEPGAPVPGVIATVTDANGNTSPFGIHNPTDPRCHDPWPDDRTTPPAFAPEDHPWAAVPVVMEEDDHLVLTTFSRTFLEEIETGLEETHVLRSPSLTRERGAPSLLAFTAINDEDLRQVYLYDLDEEDPAHVVPGDFTESWHPRLDPIVKRIALVSDDEGTPSVYIVDLDTQDILRVTDDDGTESWPDWSPDGKRLVYTSEQEGTTTLHVLDLDDGAATPMVIDLDRYGQGANRPAWGIHGDLIAFEWIDEEESPRVGWVDLRTMRTQPVPLGNETGHRDPVWVPGRGEIRFLLVTVPGVEPDTDAILAIGTLGYPRWLFSPDEESIHYRAPSVGVPVSQ
ncbi:MAG: right-handed parallel beta-helix repeat-containing protein [Candidatus Sumerlaeia bacterium]|nr:right-handed parallel beta-helix repeat-containing protein [Candidatus Sumerlaeia bacterium]